MAGCSWRRRLAPVIFVVFGLCLLFVVCYALSVETGFILRFNGHPLPSAVPVTTPTIVVPTLGP